MSLPAFFTAEELSHKIDAYFNYIEGEFHLEKKPGKEPDGEAPAARKVWDREPENGTIAGLAFFLGFDSRQAFDDYENNGNFASILRRGRLGIEAMYEKKLHLQSSTGAIFALKSMGWNDKTEGKNGPDVLKTLKVELVETGPKPAATEKEVVL
ncbi:MAG TPA: terminase small subunit [Mucilaginibacter sp.]